MGRGDTELGDYDNGSASGAGRSEYIWLPTGDGAIPVGMFRNGRFYAIHTDHLGSPRLMKDEQNRPVWQWPYSAFGAVEPTGILKATPKTPMAGTTQSIMLKKTPPEQHLTMRFPGQMRDGESGTNQNWNREYDSKSGRYRQFDPIGLRGGPNGFIYVAQNPLTNSDPTGLIRYNAPAPRTVPVEGETFNALVCLETCLKGATGNLNLDLLVTGGAEKGSHSSKSHHYKGEACDVASPRSNPAVTDEDAKMCAKACGFGAGQYETFPNNPNRDHWHFQLTPGNGVPAL